MTALLRSYVALALFAALTLDTSVSSASPAIPVTIEWLRQFGPAEDTFARGIAANLIGDVFVSSVTITNSSGSLKDVSLAKYDSHGDLAWNIPAVTNTRDANNGIWADDLGNSYIASTTRVALDGPNAGQDDAFLRKYNSAGGVVWTRQIGTAELDLGIAAVVNAQGDAFITGYTLGDLVGTKHIGWDAFLVKYDALGNHQWTKQFGTNLDDYGTGLAADAQGNVLVVGITNGSLEGTNPFPGREDAYVRKYDSSGAILWTRQLGTSGIDFAENLTVDSEGNVYVTGTTTGHLGANHFGGEDGFVWKLDADGNVQWLRQFGSIQDENSIGVAIDPVGRVFVSGQTRGSLDGTPNQGVYDAFIAVFEPNGDSLGVHQFGTTASDSAWGIASDDLGNLYVSGASRGSLPGLAPQRIGGGFIARIAVPEPNMMAQACVAMFSIVSLACGRRRDGRIRLRKSSKQACRRFPLRCPASTTTLLRGDGRRPGFANILMLWPTSRRPAEESGGRLRPRAGSS